MGQSASPEHPSSARLNFILVLLGLSVFINYIDRSNLSIAAPLLKDELRLSDWQLGWLLSTFFWTYAILQIPAGWLVDRFDVKRVFAAGFLLWSLATAFTGALHGFVALLLIRIAVGAGESIAYPSYSKILAQHFPEDRRGLANSVIASGAALGPALGLLIGGAMVGRFGWRPFFWGIGLLSLLWLLPWLIWMPARKPAEIRKKDTGMILALMKQQSFWGSCVCLFANNYYLYFLVTWLPSYLQRGRGLSIDRMAWISGLVFFLAVVSSVAMGKTSDYWIKSGGSPTRVRKTFSIVGKTGVGASLICSGFLPAPYFIWALCLAGFCHGLSTANIWAVTQTLAGPRMVGRWTGMQNFLGNLAGGIGPALTGFLVGRTGHYHWPFYVAGGMAWIGALSWIFIVGPVEPVEWDRQSIPAL